MVCPAAQRAQHHLESESAEQQFFPGRSEQQQHGNEKKRRHAGRAAGIGRDARRVEEQGTRQHQCGCRPFRRGSRIPGYQRRSISLQSDGGNAPMHIDPQAQAVAQSGSQQPGGGNTDDVSAQPIQRRTQHKAVAK
jgi:hypothetical protein